MDLAISLCVLALFGAGALFVAIPMNDDHENMPESRQLEANDEPLMTDNEKKLARAKGIIEFSVGGKRYHEPDLPKEYYL